MAQATSPTKASSSPTARASIATTDPTGKQAERPQSWTRQLLLTPTLTAPLRWRRIRLQPRANSVSWLAEDIPRHGGEPSDAGYRAAQESLATSLPVRVFAVRSLLRSPWFRGWGTRIDRACEVSGQQSSSPGLGLETAPSRCSATAPSSTSCGDSTTRLGFPLGCP